MGATDPGTLMAIAAMLVAAGALTGILAGLFGVGGGTISVPILFAVFGWLGTSAQVAMPLAVGTSLAVIIPTSIRSARAHAARGAVDRALLRAWAVPVLAGVIAGAALARSAQPWLFQAVFVAVAWLNAVKLLFGRASWRLGPDLPQGAGRAAYGAVVGLASALMGIGGGAIANLIMTLYGRPIHQAVATSAGVGVLISVPGAIGYALAGWGRAGLPPGSLGFVSLLGFALLFPTAMLAAPLGVRLAHRLSRRRLELAFGAYLAAVGGRFLLALLGWA